MDTCKDCLHYEVCTDSAEKFIDVFTSGMELSSACLNFKDRTKWAEKKKSATNADRIRAMSDEELAEWLEWFVIATVEASGMQHDDFEGGEREKLLVLLKQPAEE